MDSLTVRGLQRKRRPLHRCKREFGVEVVARFGAWKACRTEEDDTQGLFSYG